MPDYKESNIAGTQFVRCNQLIFNNPMAGDVKTVFFQEETVLNVDGMEKPIVIAQGMCHNALKPDNAGQTFQLVDFATGNVVGQATYGQVYEMLASLYLHTAMLRDNGVRVTA